MKTRKKCDEEKKGEKSRKRRKGKNKIEKKREKIRKKRNEITGSPVHIILYHSRSKFIPQP